jgi:hypothetical protein
MKIVSPMKMWLISKLKKVFLIGDVLKEALNLRTFKVSKQSVFVLKSNEISNFSKP